jgi:hypothetical protein
MAPGKPGAIGLFEKVFINIVLINQTRREFMKKVSKLLATTTGALAMFIAAAPLAAADPGYYPTGPQTNVSVSTLQSGGWTRCYFETMAVVLSPLETLKSQCQGDYVLYAGGTAADSNNYLLVAAGARQVVFNETSLAQSVSTTLGAEYQSNGSYWYAQDDLAVGFSVNAVVLLNKADVQNTNDTSRYSLHGGDAGAGYGGGWRIGDITMLNVSTDYIKAIWVSNGASPVSMPLVQTGPVIATVDKDVMTCTAGTYKVGMSEVALSSLRYHLYVNNELISSVVYDKGSNIPDILKKALPNQVSALVSAKDAVFDLSGMSSYSAHCVVEAYGYGSSTSSFSNSYQDAAFIKAANAAAQAWEDQRSTATAANFTKDMREMRKRISARQP